MQLRPPAVPLVTVDPYFSVWSMADRLTDDATRHWTGKRHAMTGLVRIDGTVCRFMGKMSADDEASPAGAEAAAGHDGAAPNPPAAAEPPALPQTGLSVRPTSTAYTFEGGGIRLIVDFTTPLLLDDLELLSRPVSYAAVHIESMDGLEHRVAVYLDATGEWAVDTTGQTVVWGRKPLPLNGAADMPYIGSELQPVLGKTGDDTRIDWGYLHLAAAADEHAAVATAIGSAAGLRGQFAAAGAIADESGFAMPRAVRDGCPAIAVALDFGAVGRRSRDGLIAIAYDDVAAIEYFGRPLPAYWRRQGATIEQAVAEALSGYADIKARCAAFDEALIGDARTAGGDRYADIAALAYRQAIAAHKLVEDAEDGILFLSKENFSNGCIGTVDVSYPSIPLFLLHNAEFVKGMMRPIFRYAQSDAWPFDFAPHDVGQYPKANGQVYGLSEHVTEHPHESQMPVEECGNMLVMAAAVAKADGNAAFAEEHWALLTQWAEYLLQHGLDPENQLCTDDFAGHLAHNANLSVKAVMGIAAYALLCGHRNFAEEQARYADTAASMAKQWIEKARDDEADNSPEERDPLRMRTKLTFDKPGTWSLKYNMIWDTLFGLNLFPQELKEQEAARYVSLQNRYGVPLDSRNTYTKIDWILWAASLTEQPRQFGALVDRVWTFLNESPSRVPMTDWYDTVSGSHIHFRNRSVVGGLFMELLKRKWLGRNLSRSEYPRPQFQRDEWLPLNGEWEFEFDDAGAGIAEKWHRSAEPFSRTIQVPFCYQSKLSGIGDTSVHDIVWYRRQVTVPPGWNGKRVLLHFGAVDYSAWVWVNGELVKFHEGGHTPFHADITDVLQEGANTIVVKAQDYTYDLTLPRGKQYWKEQSEAIFYTRTTGIWQTVWMEAIDHTHLGQVRITPLPATGEVRLDAHVNGHSASADVRLNVRISFQGNPVAEDLYQLHAADESRTIRLPHFDRWFNGWTPERPNLYDVEFNLLVNGVETDRVTSYFGMRSVTIEEGKLCLNGQPYAMKMVLDQGYFPEGLLTAPSDEHLRRDVELTKAMGFNGARKHQKIEDPRYLYWCDRLGLLVWGEAANAYGYSAQYVQRFTNEWQEAVERDYNHPCIVAWVPINESWGVPNINNDARTWHHALAMYALTKSLDPTRPVISNDGWEHVKSDLCTIHDYEWQRDVLAQRYATAEEAVAFKPSGLRLYAKGSQYAGEPILVTEFGGISFRRSEQSGWGYSNAVSEEDFLERLNNVVKPLLESPIVQGFCYTQITDVEQEINGLLTYDRKPKAPLNQIKDIIDGRWS